MGKKQPSPVSLDNVNIFNGKELWYCNASIVTEDQDFYKFLPPNRRGGEDVFLASKAACTYQIINKYLAPLMTTNFAEYLFGILYQNRAIKISEWIGFNHALTSLKYGTVKLFIRTPINGPFRGTFVTFYNTNWSLSHSLADNFKDADKTVKKINKKLLEVYNSWYHVPMIWSNKQE